MACHLYSAGSSFVLVCFLPSLVLIRSSSSEIFEYRLLFLDVSVDSNREDVSIRRKQALDVRSAIGTIKQGRVTEHAELAADGARLPNEVFTLAYSFLRFVLVSSVRRFLSVFSPSPSTN
jgi:hypothetical protein